MFFKKSPFHPT